MTDRLKGIHQMNVTQFVKYVKSITKGGEFTAMQEMARNGKMAFGTRENAWGPNHGQAG